MAMKPWSLALVLFFASTAVCSAFQNTDRPDPEGTPTVVSANVFLIDLPDVDDAKQMISANVAVVFSWQDPRLANEEGKVQVKDIDEIWNPQILIVNAQRVSPTMPQVVEISPDGTVHYRQRYFGQFSTPLRLDDFPFDSQTFKIGFVCFGYTTDEVHFDFDVVGSESGMGQTLSIEDWDITQWELSQEVFKSASHREISAFSFSFKGKRHVTYFYVKVFFPLILVIAMSWIVFWIDPVHIGPQISVAVTSMLTLIAYRFMLGNYLPRVSYLTKMDYFLLGATVMVFLALVQVATASRLAFLKKEKEARLLDRISRYVFPSAFVLLIVITLYR